MGQVVEDLKRLLDKTSTFGQGETWDYRHILRTRCLEMAIGLTEELYEGKPRPVANVYSDMSGVLNCFAEELRRLETPKNGDISLFLRDRMSEQSDELWSLSEDEKKEEMTNVRESV